MKNINKIIISFLIIGMLSSCSEIIAAAASDDTKERNEKSNMSIGAALSEVLSTELFTDENAVKVDLNSIESEYIVTTPGIYAFSGKMSGQITVNTADEGKVKLILNGVEIINDKGACIVVENADKVIISTNKDSSNILSSIGLFSEEENGKIDAAIYSKEDLNLNGDGLLAIKSSYGHGIVCKDKLKIKDGMVNITSNKKGISGKDGIEIEGGNLEILCGTNALDSQGDITITDGNVLLYSNKKDGIHTEGNVLISGGSITVKNCSEGIEGYTVTISGGETNITSHDDGINSSGKSNRDDKWQIGANPFLADDGADITISGGSITINAGGDGIDSNSILYVDGGDLYISGSESPADSAIDFATEAIISGGTVIAVGSSEMAVGFSQKSTQGNILYCFNKTYNEKTTVQLLDESGNTLLKYVSPKSFSAVNISCSEIVLGKQYIIKVDEDIFDLTMESLCYSNKGFNPSDFKPGEDRPPMGDIKPEDRRAPLKK